MSNGLIKVSSNEIRKKTSHQKLFGLDELQSYLFSVSQAVLEVDAHGLEGFKFYDVRPSTLLYGPPNTGKTTLCYLLFQKLKEEVNNEINFYYLNVGEMLNPALGQSSRNIEEAFQMLRDKSSSGSHIFLVLDELDSFCMSRSRTQEHDAIRRAMTTLMLELDKIDVAEDRTILLFGITNVLEQLDTAVVRRFSFKHSVNASLAIDDFKDFINYLSKFLNFTISSEKAEILFKIYKKRKFTLGDIKSIYRILFLSKQIQGASEDKLIDQTFKLFESEFSTIEHLVKTKELVS